MTAFEDFVNLELPRRSAFLTVAITGFDGDPNDAGAPAILKGAPTGSWYLRETPLRSFFRKEDSGSTDWINQSPSQILSPFETTGPMTLSVDFNDGAAVDPPPGAIITNQSEADAIGTTFKSLQLLWDALPKLISDAVTFNIAGGDQFVDPGQASGSVGFDLGGKIINVNTFQLVFQGASSSNYDQIVAPLTILSHTTSGGNPNLVFSGTPFTGLDLRGRFAVNSNGYVGQITDHTADTLFLAKSISPAPTNGVTTTFVGRPATKLINSKDGISRHGSLECINIANLYMKPGMTILSNEI